MSNRIIGTWSANRVGIDRSTLIEFPSQYRSFYKLYESGALENNDELGDSSEESTEATWTLVGSLLTFTFLTPPQPEYDQLDYTSEEVSFLVEFIDSNTLLLDSRPFGGESVIEYVRVDEQAPTNR